MKKEDAPFVATIHTLAWKKAYEGIVEQSFLDSIDVQQRELNWKKGIESNEPPIVRLVAERADQVLGFACGLDNRKKVELPHCDSELWAIYVHPEHANRGAGKVLLEKFKVEMRSIGRIRLCVWTLTANLPARKFYESQGGILSASREIKIGNQILPEIGYEFPI